MEVLPTYFTETSHTVFISKKVILLTKHFILHNVFCQFKHRNISEPNSDVKAKFSLKTKSKQINHRNIFQPDSEAG